MFLLLLPLLAAFLALIAVLAFLLVFGSCLLERRPVQPYDVPPPGEEGEPTAKAAAANRAARRLGYRQAGVCRDGKGRLYKVRYDFWLSPDGRTLGVVGGGRVAGVRTDEVWLWSRVAGGRVLATTNLAGEPDLSGVEEQEVRPKRDFGALAARHAERLAGLEAEPFPAGRPLAGHLEIRRRKAESLVERGYAYFVDGDRTAVRYTLRGAAAYYVAAIWTQPTAIRERDGQGGEPLASPASRSADRAATGAAARPHRF